LQAEGKLKSNPAETLASPKVGKSLPHPLNDNEIDELLEQLRAAGVAIIQGPESHENGKFAWIMDPDENKVELWEPKAASAESTGA